MDKIRAILFDNDGTLVDTHDLILSSLQYSTYEVLGRRIPEETLMRKVGQPLAAQMNDFTDDPELRKRLVSTYREHNHAHHDEAVHAFPGVEEGLRTLVQRGYTLGVVTSKLHDLAWRGLELTGLAPYLSCCIGMDDCVRHKPDAEPVLRGCEALSLPPECCAYVGDSPFDLQAGRAAGCRTVAALWGMFKADELSAELPDASCASFEDLLTVFDVFPV